MECTIGELNSIQELEAAIVESDQQPVLLFKHSTTCPISARAFREFKRYLAGGSARVAYRLITIQAARDVSNEAAAKLDIRHESPQAILVVQRRGVWVATHYDITSQSIQEAIDGAVRPAAG